jgi:methylmalonyl-CoA mutase cobalamin-binding subunit
VFYLGAELPAAEVVSAARETGADAVALSIVYDTGEASLLAAIREVRDGLPDGVPLMVGGAAGVRLAARVEAAGAIVLGTLSDFRALLRRLDEEGGTP